MNKEYAEFFENKESFIEKVILTDEGIAIYHPNNKKPTIFENNKKKLTYTKKRLMSQAKAIVDNSEKIIKQNPRSKKLNYIVIISMIISLLLVIVNFFAMPATIIPILFASIGITIASATTIYNLIKNANQRKELNNYEFYLENIEEMKNQILEDENMTRYLSDDAKNLLQNNELDIIVVDKLIEEMPKDFDTLMERSIINNGLKKPVSFNYEKYRKEKNTYEDDYEQPSKPHVKKRTKR